MRRIASRALIGAGLVAISASGGAAVEIAAAHKSAAPVQIRFVASSDPNTPGAYEVRIRSRVRACYRRVPVRLVQNGRVVFANFTNADGVVISPRDNKPRAFGEEFAGSRVVVRSRTVSRRGDHRHGCAGATRVFQPFG